MPQIKLTDATVHALHRTNGEPQTDYSPGSHPVNAPGAAIGNKVLMSVQALWNSWDKRHDLPIRCPVRRLELRPIAPRQNRLDDFPGWLAKVEALSNRVRRDVQLFALFSG